MDRKILFVLPLSWVLVGCVNTGLLNVSNCDVYTGPVPPCQGSPNAPAINLNTNTLNVDLITDEAEQASMLADIEMRESRAMSELRK